jgi:transcriptional regulator with XRE-family HTH domain
MMARKKKTSRRGKKKPTPVMTYDKWLTGAVAELEDLRRQDVWQYDDGVAVNEIALTYSQVAARSGLCATTVSNLLRGKTKRPAFRTMFNIHAGLGKEMEMPDLSAASLPVEVTGNRMKQLLTADKAMKTRLANQAKEKRQGKRPAKKRKKAA